MKPAAKYAQGTTVSAEKSEMEIKTLLRKRGADQVWSGSGQESAQIGFKMHSRHVRMSITYPPPCKPREVPAKRDAEIRRLWRALLLALKAKLEVVDSGIETFEVAFMASIVAPDGRTVGELAGPAIAAMYAKGVTPPSFLSLPSGKPGDVVEGEFES